VAFLGLLDSFSPILTQRWPVPDDLAIVLGAGAHAATRAGQTLSITPEELEGLPWDEQVARVVDHLQGQGRAIPGLDRESFGEDCRARRDRFTCMSAYVPGTLRGAVTLFRAGDSPERAGGSPAEQEEWRTLGWSALSSSPVELHRVPGNHVTITTEPHVRVLAELVRESLESARLRTGNQSAEPTGRP
jgi:thioesterase domain-containing protein